jgi:hypothetical protein
VNNAVLTIGAQSIGGVKTFTDVPVCATLPTLASHLSNKEYVDNLVNYSQSWQSPVEMFYDFSLGDPVGLVTGNRYISSTTFGSFDQWYIYTYIGGSYVETQPFEGFCLYVKDVDKNYIFSETSTWVVLGLTLHHGDLQDLGNDQHGQYFMTNGRVADILRVTNTTASVNITTGCSVYSGGVGVALNAYIGGRTVVGANVADGFTWPTNNSIRIITDKATSDVILNDLEPMLIFLRKGTTGISNNAGASFAISRFAHTGTSSNSRLDLELFTGWGLKVQVAEFRSDKSVILKGITTISDETDSTSPSTGASIINGGLGVAKSLSVGGTIRNFSNVAQRKVFANQSLGVKAVTTWYIRTSATNNNWISVCWSPELSIFCAVSYTGTNNRVMTSPDGITWTPRTSALDNDWRSVCWSPELSLFCAVSYNGTNNRVMTSPNGITWTSRTSAVDNEWNSVCWSPELSLFCAVSYNGTNNRVMTSPDGITWTSRTSAVDNDWRSVCWSPELSIFCAVASTGTNNRVMTSPDGITWTSRTSAVDNDWCSVCWSPELSLFCAVSYSGTNNRVMTSPDGITWTSRTSAADTYWYGVCWSPELGIFCAVATSITTSSVMISKKVLDRTFPNNTPSNLYVNGDLHTTGILSKVGGSFNIPHPNPEKKDWKLRHCFVESPSRGENLYRYVVETKKIKEDEQLSTTTITLPDYFQFLNSEFSDSLTVAPQVFVNPVGIINGMIGYGFGVVNPGMITATITTTIPGKYNILIIATRNDKVMHDYWDQQGAEVSPTLQM